MPSVPPDQSDALLLQMLVPNLEAEGSQVLLNPSHSVLPPCVHCYRPDAIALRADKKLAREQMGDPITIFQGLLDLSTDGARTIRLSFVRETFHPPSLEALPQ